MQIQEIIMAYRCGVFSHFFLICAIWIFSGFFVTKKIIMKYFCHLVSINYTYLVTYLLLWSHNWIMEPLKCFSSQHRRAIKFTEIFVNTLSLNSHVYYRIKYFLKILSYFWKFSLLLFCFLSSLPAVCTMQGRLGAWGQ